MPNTFGTVLYGTAAPQRSDDHSRVRAIIYATDLVTASHCSPLIRSFVWFLPLALRVKAMPLAYYAGDYYVTVATRGTGCVGDLQVTPPAAPLRFITRAGLLKFPSLPFLR